jgi:photosystem II stability/assembly factor-like uncharacterized protein
LETLADRIVLSTSIPLNSSSWTAIGPAPLVNGITDYTENTSGRVTGLAADPTDANTLYVAAAGGGVWKTTDGGVTWAPRTDDQATLFMGAIALAPSDPQIIYAGTGEANMGPSKVRESRDNIYYGRGVLKSTDGGASWSLLGQAQFDRRTISRIVVDPGDANTVYVAIGALATNGLPGNTGVWKSTDGGATWADTTAGISTVAAFSDLVMDPSNPQTLYAAVGEPGRSPVNSVYKTTNGGASWARAGNFPTGQGTPSVGRITLAVASGAPQTLYAAVTASGQGSVTAGHLYGMYKSVDGGAHWDRLPQPPNYMSAAGDYHTALAVDPASADTVYAGGEYLIASTDGGQSWATIAPGDTDGPHHDNHALGFDAAGRLLDGNDGGIWRLESLTPLVWSNLNGNLQITQFVGLALHPSNADIAYGGTQDNGTVQFTDDLAWSRLQRGDGGGVAVSPSSPNTVYHIVRGSAFFDSHFFQRSTNGGQSWLTRVDGIDLSDPKNLYPPFVMDPADPTRLLLGTNRVYETTNRGDHWTPISTGWSANIDSVAAAGSDRNTVYATAGGHIFVTFDDGATWQQHDVAGVTDHFQKLLVDPGNNLVAYAVRDRFGAGHVYQTTDGGQNWADISGDLPDLPAYALALDGRTATLYVGNDSGVYASTDGGSHWVRYQTGLPNVQVNDLELNPSLNILAAGTHGRGVWQILLDAGATGRRNRVVAGVTIGWGARLADDGPMGAGRAWGDGDSVPRMDLKELADIQASDQAAGGRTPLTVPNGRVHHAARLVAGERPSDGSTANGNGGLALIDSDGQDDITDLDPNSIIVPISP